ncbi:MAG: hypothetical protein OXG85_02745 [Chloroflexi bacterium]|nr:hypothetical protein [Chloroflexota bacterium]
MPANPPRQQVRSIFRHWRLPLLCLLILMTAAASAQETGQICVLTFDDRDGNGSRDADERSITHGIGASLLNADGVTIAAALLDDSPFAANGLMCFDQLRAGEYRLRVTSAEFIGTAASTFAASVNPGDAPARIEFGVRPLLADDGSSAGALALDAAAVAALANAILVGALVFVVMSVIGLLIYILVFRRRRKRARAMTASPAHQSTQNPPTSGGPLKDG